MQYKKAEIRQKGKKMPPLTANFSPPPVESGTESEMPNEEAKEKLKSVELKEDPE